MQNADKKPACIKHLSTKTKNKYYRLLLISNFCPALGTSVLRSIIEPANKISRITFCPGRIQIQVGSEFFQI